MDASLWWAVGVVAQGFGIGEGRSLYGSPLI
jgi:hypothetical protein